MIQLSIRAGAQIVIASSNGKDSPWAARLYVNNGETATPVVGRSKTEAGIRKWAEKTLALHMRADILRVCAAVSVA